MLQSLLLLLILYVIWTVNLNLVTDLISRGWLSKPFWTRSIRATFAVPPFGFALWFCIFLIESVAKNIENFSQIMTKRENF
jgi:hypothetical protein